MSVRIKTTVSARPTHAEPGVPEVFMDLVHWMEDNIGELYKEWDFDPTDLAHGLITVRVMNDEKATLTKLRWS